jgi:hypothetical protein
MALVGTSTHADCRGGPCRYTPKKKDDDSCGAIILALILLPLYTAEEVYLIQSIWAWHLAQYAPVPSWRVLVAAMLAWGAFQGRVSRKQTAVTRLVEVILARMLIVYPFAYAVAWLMTKTFTVE